MAWEKRCLPIDSGGLGIKKLVHFNRALVEKALIFGGGLLLLNMERVKGDGLLIFVERHMDVVCGMVFMKVRTISPNMWP